MSIIPKYAVAPVEPYTDIIASWSTTPGMTVENTSSRTITYSWKPDSVVTTSPTAYAPQRDATTSPTPAARMTSPSCNGGR
jgi:hypothetical protein